MHGTACNVYGDGRDDTKHTHKKIFQEVYHDAFTTRDATGGGSCADVTYTLVSSLSREPLDNSIRMHRYVYTVSFAIHRHLNKRRQMC